MNGFSLNNITDCKYGSTHVSALYLGSTLIWPTGPTPPHDYSQDYTTISIISAGDLYFSHTYGPAKTISYSTDSGTTWTQVSSSSSGTLIGNFSIGDNLLVKGNNDSYAQAGMGCNIKGTAGFDVSGNIMSLIYEDNFIGQTSFPIMGDYAFANLFNLSNVRNANNLILPATTLTIGCYSAMFNSCYNLISAPELPATTLMSLCYYMMFAGCTSLTTAPELPATILVSNCYNQMFNDCTSLNYIKCLATDISANACTQDWTNNVAASGTFVKDANTTWPSGSSGIPSNWTTVQNA